MVHNNSSQIFERDCVAVNIYMTASQDLKTAHISVDAPPM